MFDILLHNPTLALFVVITSGLLLGRIQIFGVSLGSSGVIFTALLAGHLGSRIPEGVGTLGLVIFVYIVGLRAGPTFFRSFRGQGGSLAKMAVVLTFIGAATAWACGHFFRIPVDLAAGIFAGALTSTPGLAAAMERLPADSQIAVGYGIAYPVGVIAVVLFVQLLPRLLRQDLNELGHQLKESNDPGRRIVRTIVEVINPAVIGKRLPNIEFIGNSNCRCPSPGGQQAGARPAGFHTGAGQFVLVIGREFRVPNVVDLLGKKVENVDYHIDTERERQRWS